jgi:hypothetical protein
MMSGSEYQKQYGTILAEEGKKDLDGMDEQESNDENDDYEKRRRTVKKWSTEEVITKCFRNIYIFYIDHL